MIRICVATLEDHWTSTILGNISSPNSTQRALELGEGSSPLRRIVALAHTWQYRSDKNSLVDISDVFEGIFSDDI